MYAVIAEGGGQRMVEKDDIILVDLLNEGKAGKGASHTYKDVLIVGSGDGTAVAKIGQPYVAGASVTVEVLEPLVKGDKVFIHKFRRRKGFKKKTGHRQTYTKVKVTAING
ncbi:MAG: 50S ribosomal protein L21 [Phycisphaerales bacterium]|nr:50S ribosomal protein L21 [Phycisphaerales bacterium]